MKFWPFQSPAKAEIKDSDWGRRYGWTAEKDNKVIGTLDFIRWDDDSQFWHEYRLTIEDPDQITMLTDPDEWRKQRIILRNRKYKDIIISDFLTSTRMDGIIAIRFASVPEERFQRQ